MPFFSSLERRFGWISIDRLPIYVVTAQAISYVWIMMNPEQAHMLLLDRSAVLEGREYWRLLTFLFVVPVQNPIFAFLYLYLQYALGNSLEEMMGTFSFSLYYLVGAAGTLVAGLLFGSWDGAFFINTSVFLAFAALNPDFRLLLFFVIPVKIKWLALVTWLWFAWRFVLSPLPVRAAIVASLANYLLFFGRQHYEQVRDRVALWRHRRKFRDWGGE